MCVEVPEGVRMRERERESVRTCKTGNEKRARNWREEKNEKKRGEDKSERRRGEKLTCARK